MKIVYPVVIIISLLISVSYGDINKSLIDINNNIDESYKFWSMGNNKKATELALKTFKKSERINYDKGVLESAKILFLSDYKNSDDIFNKLFINFQNKENKENYILILLYKTQSLLSQNKKMFPDYYLNEAKKHVDNTNNSSLINLVKIYEEFTALMTDKKFNHDNLILSVQLVQSPYYLTELGIITQRFITHYLHSNMIIKAENLLEIMQNKITQKRSPFLYALFQYNKALIHFEKGNITQSINEYLVSYKEYHNLGNIDMQITILNNIGWNYKIIGDTYNALKSYFRALELKQNTSERPFSYIYDNIGEIYYDIGNYHEAIEYFKKAISSSLRSKNRQIVAVSNINISKCLIELNNLDRAMSRLNFAEETPDIKNYNNEMANIHLYKSMIYGRKNNLFLQLDHLNKALAYKEKINKLFKAHILYHMGIFYYNKKDYNNGLKYMLDSFHVYEKIGEKNMISHVLKYIASIYEINNNTLKSNEFYEKYVQIQEYKNSMLQRTTSIQLSYEIENREKAISLLEKDQKIKELEITRQRWIMGILIIGFIIISLLIYIINREKNKVKEFLNTLNKELAVAKKIQNSIIPKTLPVINNVELDAKYLPMENVGGDFYDFYVLDENRFGIFISDVSGHGIPAALISSMVKIAFSMLRKYANSPKKLIKRLNNILSDKIKGRFITAGYVLIDLEKNEVIYSSAGHPPIYIYKKNEKKIGEFIANGILIGYNEKEEYDEISIKIEKGDKIILYTDGIIEAFNDKGEMFGENRVKDIIRENGDNTIFDISNVLIKSIVHWIKIGENINKYINDDITLIGLEIK